MQDLHVHTDLGSKPADTLVKKVSNAVGGLFAPHQRKRIAKAEAEADLIKAQSEIEITDLRRRAFRRWIEEEATQQKNMEDVTVKALPQLNDNANPDSIEDDWIVNFFNKSRIVSDNEMQGLWSRVLAGEANAPGTYSKRTVNFLSDIDKTEAGLFTKLCGFAWMIGEHVPLVFDVEAEIHKRHEVNYRSLSHLDSVGLIRFNNFAGFVMQVPPKRFSVTYYDRRLTLEIPKEDANKPFGLGKVMLTRIGKELAPICGGQPVEGFWEYMKDQWKEYLPKPKPEPEGE